MKTLCGADCSICDLKNSCKGCIETNGSPFGGRCIAAEYIKAGGMKNFDAFKKTLIEEINQLSIEGMPKINNLNCLCGSFVNLEYELPGGAKAKFLDDRNIYLGTQVESLFSDGDENARCFGVVADTTFILICEYGPMGQAPEIVLYKRR